MNIGLIGLPMSGKSTFFNLLTQIDPFKDSASGKTGVNKGIAKIPDKRVDLLSGIFNPKKTTHATVEVIDIPGITASGPESKGSTRHFLEEVRKTDTLVHVVRAFENPDVVHAQGSVDAFRDLYTMQTEMVFADLSVIENRINRITSSAKVRKEELEEKKVLEKCMEGLEGETPIHNLALDEEEKNFLKAFDFLTERPMILLVNLDEEQYRAKDYPNRLKVMEYAREYNMPYLEICAKIEHEISQLDESDRTLFLEDLGIRESGTSKLATAMYRQMGLISFLTIGEDEVRAWPVRRGISAGGAGGKIHSDIQRGFIRAEVVTYEDFMNCGSLQKVKEKGLARLIGKDAEIKDGDILNFRFNV